jgi:hypothetical protein
MILGANNLRLLLPGIDLSVPGSNLVRLEGLLGNEMASAVGLEG